MTLKCLLLATSTQVDLFKHIMSGLKPSIQILSKVSGIKLSYFEKMPNSTPTCLVNH